MTTTATLATPASAPPLRLERRHWLAALAVLLTPMLTVYVHGGGAGANAPAPLSRAAAPPVVDWLSPPALVGRQLFFDTALSASGKMSCATCHDPRFAYGPPNDLAVQRGGPALADWGTRAVGET